MPIIYHEKERIFHLYNNKVSYIINILKNGQIGNLYYGAKIKDNNFEHLFELLTRCQATCTYEEDSCFSLEHIKQEYPTYGSGDMREPALDIVQKNGSRIIDFKYQEHHIFNGKKKLDGLPACYVDDEDEATTLEIVLYDKIIDTQLILSYSIYEHLSAICRHSKIKNNGNETITLNRCMSLNVDLPDTEYNMIELTGAWGRERNIKERSINQGINSIYSLRGRSSGEFNPFIALKRKNTDEYQGEVLGFCLVYSGNFLASVDADTYNVSRVMLGIHPHTFEWALQTGEEFISPEAIMVYSHEGMNKMSQTYHDLFRNHLINKKYRNTLRPILLNNWEGTRFDFDEEKILNIARTGKKLGIELFVLDDGWFGQRNSDTEGLGDWYPNLDKLPSGISGLSQKINDMGLKFGIWIEPEMTNKNSKFFKEHQDWVLHVPKRPISQGRNQYVVDYSNDQAVDYIYQMLEKVISESHISYIKWDMNRMLSEVYSLNTLGHLQGKVMHKYVLGVYNLYERLIDKFPEILIESCSAGGNRFDAGMLYYAPMAWASDNTDAVERLKIQYGSSLVYPLSSMGSHVSEVPNYLMNRNVSLETRVNVACFGSYGYELDPTTMSDEDIKKLSEYTAIVKKYRKIIQFGDLYRLKSPFSSNTVVWMVVSKDRKMALVGYYRILEKTNSGYERVKLQGLDPNYKYHVSINEYDCYGDELMNYGLITSDHSSGVDLSVNEPFGDYISKIYVIEKCK